MNLSVRHFKAFLAIANSHSFTRAAEQLPISQPGLSLMVQEIENQLSCRLFDRTTRSVQLTPAGQRLLPVARRVVTEVEGIASTLTALSEKRRHTLRVGAPPIFATTVMPEVYMRLRRTHPELDLHISDLPKPEVERQVRDGQIDCGFGSFPRRIPDVSNRLLFDFDFVYLESSQMTWREKREETICWRDLPDVPFVEQGAVLELQTHVNRCRATCGMSRSDGITLNDLASQVSMAVAGVGPTIIPSFAVPVNAPISTSLLVDPVLSLGYHVIMKRGREQPAALDDFIATFLEVVEAHKTQVYSKFGI